MTLQLAQGGPDRLTVRFIPWLNWSFALLVLYGISTVALAVFNGTQSFSSGEAIGLVMLFGLVIFTLITGGRLGICRIDRRRGLISITSYGLLGRAHQERRLDDVKGLEVRILRRAQYRLLLALRSGEKLPLAPFYLISVNDRGIRRIASALNVEPEFVQDREKPGIFGR